MVAFTLRADDRLLQPVEEECPIGQVSQRIMQGAMLERRFHVAALCEVPDHSHHAVARGSE
jgi:hypothetical protein